MEFTDKHHMSEQETEDLLRSLDKENVELITQEELESAQADLESIEEEATKIKAKKSPLVVEPEEESEDDDDTERESIPTQITDSVKSLSTRYRKIPLLNKKTETAIAEQISQAKKDSIRSYFSFSIFT